MDRESKMLLAAAAMLELYQTELIRLFKLNHSELHSEFKRQFDDRYGQVIAAVADNALESELKSVCHRMRAFLHNEPLHKAKAASRKVATHKAARVSLPDSHALQTAQTRMREDHRREVNDILMSYRIEPTPPMGMMWRDAYSRQTSRGDSTIPNTIDLLADAIPQMQDSIRRLSLQKPTTVIGQEVKTERPRRRVMPFLF